MITIFLAGKKTFGDLTSDFERLRENSGILSHYSESFECPDCGFHAIQSMRPHRGSQKCKASTAGTPEWMKEVLDTKAGKAALAWILSAMLGLEAPAANTSRPEPTSLVEYTKKPLHS